MLLMSVYGNFIILSYNKPKLIAWSILVIFFIFKVTSESSKEVKFTPL